MTTRWKLLAGALGLSIGGLAAVASVPTTQKGSADHKMAPPVTAAAVERAACAPPPDLPPIPAPPEPAPLPPLPVVTTPAEVPSLPPATPIVPVAGKADPKPEDKPKPADKPAPKPDDKPVVPALPAPKPTDPAVKEIPFTMVTPEPAKPTAPAPVVPIAAADPKPVLPAGPAPAPAAPVTPEPVPFTPNPIPATPNPNPTPTPVQPVPAQPAPVPVQPAPAPAADPAPLVQPVPAQPAIDSAVVPAGMVEKKLKVMLHMGDDRPRFEVRDGDEVYLKVICDKVDVKSPSERGETMSQMKAAGKVSFVTPGGEGSCDELTVAPGTGQVVVTGKVTFKYNWGKVETTVSGDRMTFRLGTAPGMMPAAAPATAVTTGFQKRG